TVEFAFLAALLRVPLGGYRDLEHDLCPDRLQAAVVGDALARRLLGALGLLVRLADQDVLLLVPQRRQRAFGNAQEEGLEVAATEPDRPRRALQHGDLAVKGDDLSAHGAAAGEP